jgi:hypothetical protein
LSSSSHLQHFQIYTIRRTNIINPMKAITIFCELWSSHLKIENKNNDVMYWCGYTSARTACPSGAPKFTLGFSRVRVVRVICIMFCRSLYVCFPSGAPGVRVAQYCVSCVVFCRSLLVLLSFFIWQLHCLSFFDLRLLITAFVLSNFSS